MKQEKWILDLREVGLQDLPLVGGKNASLGEMQQNLHSMDIRVPNGFVVSVPAYRHFLEHNQLMDRIRGVLDGFNANDLSLLSGKAKMIRDWIVKGQFPESLEQEIFAAYEKLSQEYGMTGADVAVRSSATAEDLPNASFAGQQDTFLNVRGKEDMLLAIRKCFASLFTDRALSYRQNLGFDHFKVGISVCVQKMVRSDKAVSGVAFSLDTESGFREVVVINASYGLGELIVQGAVSPDEFIVFKPSLHKGLEAVIERRLGVKDKKMMYSDLPGERVRITDCSANEQNRFCLSKEMACLLARWVVSIEAHYSLQRGGDCPMDIEWAIDGDTNELFIVQARPETIHRGNARKKIKEYVVQDPDREKKIVLKGIAVGDGIACGRVHVLDNDLSELQQFKKGDVLVTDMTDPDWEPVMKLASAIITNKGGRTCHAAIVAREMNVPAIVGTGNATALLSNGQFVTVSCAEGVTGIVYEGEITFSAHEVDLDSIPDTQLPVLLNIGSPEMAFHYAHLPSKGIGLAREEFIINNYIQVHPLALLQQDKLTDPDLLKKINSITRGYNSGKEFFIEKLASGVARIAASFYPRPVIVRFSDFKTNEYFNLIGGNNFEPKEENPMLGWRGASRYYSREYREAFGMECSAIRRVREEMGLDNLIVMIPFCRTVAELLDVYDIMEHYGLKRGEKGLQVYLMAELPSNIIMAREFSRHIDGFSIGSNDLTQLVLGLDRDSSLVAHLYDERNEAVKAMISNLIDAAREAGIKVGICGQGPSDFPDFTAFLVEKGIDTVSVTPDSFFKTIATVHRVEKEAALI